MSKPTRRTERVNALVQEELASLLLRDIKDECAAAATLTSVEVSPDLRSAKIYIAPGPGRDLEVTLASLARVAGFLKRELGRRLRMRHVPDLHFFYDDSFDYGSKIDRLLHEIAGDRGTSVRTEDDPAAADDRIRLLLSDAKRILLSTHVDPDGDAIGSVLAFRLILIGLGKETMVYHPEGFPSAYDFLVGSREVERSIADMGRFDLTVLLDTASASLLPDPWPARDVTGPLVSIDHHPQGDLGDVVLREDAAATGEIILRLADDLGVAVGPEMAECLYTAILTDTGSFRYANTSDKTFRSAARLIDAGVDPWRVASSVYESFRPERFRALSFALARLKVSQDGRFASLSLSREEIAKSGVTPSDLEGFVNYARSVRGVEVAAFLREEKPGEVRVSLRSRGDIDVSLLASRFGGGGHKNASGCTLQGTPESAQEIIELAVKALWE